MHDDEWSGSTNAQRRRWDSASAEYGSVLGAEDPSESVDCLAGLAKGKAGVALELGVGTGRVARPLSACVARVDGVDISPSMVDRLSCDDDSRTVNGFVASMSDLPFEPQSYDLVYSLNSSFYYLTSQDEQITCLGEAARVLKPDGLLVLECFNPLTSSLLGHLRTEPRKSVAIRAMGEEHVSLSLSQTDFTTQITYTQEIGLGGGGVKLLPMMNRFVWASELDLMARIAGLKVVSRYSGWACDSAFRANSDYNHLSIFELA